MHSSYHRNCIFTSWGLPVHIMVVHTMENIQLIFLELYGSHHGNCMVYVVGVAWFTWLELYSSHHGKWMVYVFWNIWFTPSELQGSHCGIAWFTPWEIHGRSQQERFPEPKTIATVLLNQWNHPPLSVIRTFLARWLFLIFYLPPGPWQSGGTEVSGRY